MTKAKTQSSDELRGFAPIGMLEGWNSGIMGHGKLEWWINGEIHLDKKTKRLIIFF